MFLKRKCRRTPRQSHTLDEKKPTKYRTEKFLFYEDNVNNKIKCEIKYIQATVCICTFIYVDSFSLSLCGCAAYQIVFLISREVDAHLCRVACDAADTWRAAERKMAASTFYLEHYLDSLEDLPVDLKNNFSRMHDLDKRYQFLVPGTVNPTTVP